METETSRQNLLQSFRQDGYAVVEFPLTISLSGLFAKFDQLATNPAYATWRSQIQREEKYWLSREEEFDAYAFAPKIFSLRKSNAGRLEKAYFQLSAPFYNHLKTHRDSCLHSVQMFSDMCDQIMDVLISAEAILLKYSKVLSGANKMPPRLSVLMKVLMSEPSENWATSPHFDKSVFTLAIGSDDMENENLRLGAYLNETGAALLQRPNRKKIGGDGRHTSVMLPGMGMRESRISDLYPSPHAAVPVDKRRHSLIAFLVDLDIDIERLRIVESEYVRAADFS